RVGARLARHGRDAGRSLPRAAGDRALDLCLVDSRVPGRRDRLGADRARPGEPARHDRSAEDAGLSMSWKRIAILGAAAVAVVAAFVWAFRPQPVPVDLATVAARDLEITVADEGLARISEVYVVSAPVAGTVLRTPVDPGDAVVRGETVVATIEPARPAFLDVRARREVEASVEAARAALALAEAEVTRAEAEVEFWEADLIRQEMLRSRGTIAQ